MRLPSSGRSSSGIGAVVLDRQVGDAAPRVEPVGRDDGLRRADVDAGAAAAAMRAGRRRGRQRQVDEDLAQEEHRAALALQRQRVLAAPADAAARGQLHLEHRRRIGEDARAERADLLRQPVGQRLQPRAQHLVVVAAARVDRHRRLLRAAQALPLHRLPARRRGARQVVHARGDHAHRARHQLGRTRALRAVALHVVHRAVEALRQPGVQAGLGRAQVHAGHTDLGESQPMRPLPQLRQQLLPVEVMTLTHAPILETRTHRVARRGRLRRLRRPRWPASRRCAMPTSNCAASSAPARPPSCATCCARWACAGASRARPTPCSSPTRCRGWRSRTSTSTASTTRASGRTRAFARSSPRRA